MKKIQLYQNVIDNAGIEITVNEVIDIIAGRNTASSNIEKRISNIRKYVEAIAALKINIANEPNEAKWKTFLAERVKQYEDLKKGLPAVTWSGTFTKRNAKNLKEYSQYICIDIDKLTDDGILKALWFNLSTDPHTYILFVSPSGNGIKLIFKTVAEPAQHKDFFLSIEKYFLDKFNIAIDQSGKDVNRLCFLSYDKNIFINENSLVYQLPVIVEPEITEVDKKKLSKISLADKQSLKVTGQQVNDIWESTQSVIDFATGNRNNFIFKFACNCNRVGITLLECVSFAQSAAYDKQPNEVEATIKSAYTANAHEFAKYKAHDKTNHQTKDVVISNNVPPSKQQANGKIQDAAKARSSSGHKSTAGSSSDEPNYIFWKEHKTEKGKGDKKYTVSRLELSRVEFCEFLHEEGFHLLPTGDEEGFQIVHSRDGIIKPIAPNQIKHYSLDWCKRYWLREVEEMLRKGQTKYFAKNELDSLPYKDVELKRDTEQETFFYFSNCYISIDKKGKIHENNYTNVHGYIWESNKIKHEYKDINIDIIDKNNMLLPYDQINCEFAKFVAYASHNPNNEDEKHFDKKVITDRFLSFCSAIGFLLDGYKHPSRRKAIFAIDHKIGERNEANGRTGKSMIPQACEKLKKVANISGKNYDPKYQFCDEPITVDTQIINFNDMQRNFDVENIFEKIADPYSVNRRNQGFIHFKYINSPKIYYSTNFIPKGEGESYKSRMNVIEFSDYFNSGHTPYDEFGHGFFDDSWDADEWQRFYNFMVWCVAYHKENGLVEYPFPNISQRKLINDVVPEFIDFIEDDDLVPKNIRTAKLGVFEKFNVIYFQLYNKRLTSHMFTIWLRKFCEVKGYKLNPKQGGKPDKSNSVEYITIANDKYQPI